MKKSILDDINIQNNLSIQMVATHELRHIEGFSKSRMIWLKQKIELEQVWTRPLCVDKNHFLVMDGQHRMEVSLALGLKAVPCVLFSYDEVEIWSLRKNHIVTPDLVIKRSLEGNIYPYKTVKHKFPVEIPELLIPLKELINL